MDTSKTQARSNACLAALTVAALLWTSAPVGFAAGLAPEGEAGTPQEAADDPEPESTPTSPTETPDESDPGTEPDPDPTDPPDDDEDPTAGGSPDGEGPTNGSGELLGGDTAAADEGGADEGAGDEGTGGPALFGAPLDIMGLAAEFGTSGPGFTEVTPLQGSLVRRYEWEIEKTLTSGEVGDVVLADPITGQASADFLVTVTPNGLEDLARSISGGFTLENSDEGEGLLITRLRLQNQGGEVVDCDWEEIVYYSEFSPTPEPFPAEGTTLAAAGGWSEFRFTCDLAVDDDAARADVVLVAWEPRDEDDPGEAEYPLAPITDWSTALIDGTNRNIVIFDNDATADVVTQIGTANYEATAALEGGALEIDYTLTGLNGPNHLTAGPRRYVNDAWWVDVADAETTTGMVGGQGDSAEVWVAAGHWSRVLVATGGVRTSPGLLGISGVAGVTFSLSDGTDTVEFVSGQVTCETGPDDCGVEADPRGDGVAELYWHNPGGEWSLTAVGAPAGWSLFSPSIGAYAFAEDFTANGLTHCTGGVTEACDSTFMHGPDGSLGRWALVRDNPAWFDAWEQHQSVAIIVDAGNVAAALEWLEALQGSHALVSIYEVGATAPRYSQEMDSQAQYLAARAAVSGVGAGDGNWDASLWTARGSDLVIFLADSDPTTYVSKGSSGPGTSLADLEAAIFSANAIKDAGGYVLVGGAAADLGAIGSAAAVSLPDLYRWAPTIEGLTLEGVHQDTSFAWNVAVAPSTHWTRPGEGALVTVSHTLSVERTDRLTVVGTLDLRLDEASHCATSAESADPEVCRPFNLNGSRIYLHEDNGHSPDVLAVSIERDWWIEPGDAGVITLVIGTRYLPGGVEEPLNGGAFEATVASTHNTVPTFTATAHWPDHAVDPGGSQATTVSNPLTDSHPGGGDYPAYDLTNSRATLLTDCGRLNAALSTLPGGANCAAIDGEYDAFALVDSPRTVSYTIRLGDLAAFKAGVRVADDEAANGGVADKSDDGEGRLDTWSTAATLTPSGADEWTEGRSGYLEFDAGVPTNPDERATAVTADNRQTVRTGRSLTFSETHAWQLWREYRWALTMTVVDGTTHPKGVVGPTAPGQTSIDVTAT
ncbi:MAG: hypothetical protein FWG11_06825, partial [Promicromonosporaceae bacterium]|nr:hypothetical protein [Promicromonosporaceae bacterium]